MRDDTCDAFALLSEQGLFGEALVCLYSAIDALAWIQNARERDTVTRAEFIAWARDHMEVEKRLGVDADSVYAARCTLVHQRISRHRRVHSGEIAEIQYSFAGVLVGAVTMGWRSTDGQRGTTHLVVNAAALVDAFREGTESARRAAIAAGREEWARIASRTQMFLLPTAPDLPHRLSRRAYPNDVAEAFGRPGMGPES